MKVLIIGPCHDGGSLPPYLDALAEGLRSHGVTAGRLGSAGLPYDTEARRFHAASRVISTARDIAARAGQDWDLLSVHFGNLETEQLVPALLTGQPRPPAVCHVHTLEPTLFRDHLPIQGLHRAVTDASRALDGYVYFGKYARDRHAAAIPAGVPSGVAWLPTTIPAGTAPAAGPELGAALRPPDGRPVISLYGYAAPWKDAALLQAAARLMRVPARIVVAGDFWDDPAQAGTVLPPASRPARLGAAELVIVPGYLGPPARAALALASAAAVFPYRPHPSFQGSGAIADYLARGVPVITTDVANMAELAGSAGQVVPPADPAALAAALDTSAAARPAAPPARAASARASQFTAAAHAARCLEVYRQVLARAGRPEARAT